MSVQDTNGPSLEGIGELLVDTIGRPVRGAALFYSLYWLVEMEGDQGAVFDFEQLRREYAEGFYWYALFSSAQEAAHVWDRYFVDGFTVSSYMNERTVNVSRDPTGETIEEVLQPGMMDAHGEELFPERAAFRDTFRSLLRHSRDLSSAATGEGANTFDIEEFLRVLGNYTLGTEDPEFMLEFLAALFERSQVAPLHPEQVDLPPDMTGDDWLRLDRNTQIRVGRLSGWINDQWDGPGWAAIPQHALRRDELSATAWVDQCWSIEHNNNVWVDKVQIDREDLEVVGEMDDVLTGLPSTVVVMEAVEEILDAAREGDMGTVFDWAVHFTDDDVGVNLRRARTVYGL